MVGGGGALSLVAAAGGALGLAAGCALGAFSVLGFALLGFALLGFVPDGRAAAVRDVSISSMSRRRRIAYSASLRTSLKSFSSARSS